MEPTKTWSHTHACSVFSVRSVKLWWTCWRQQWSRKTRPVTSHSLWTDYSRNMDHRERSLLTRHSFSLRSDFSSLARRTTAESETLTTDRLSVSAQQTSSADTSHILTSLFSTATFRSNLHIELGQCPPCYLAAHTLFPHSISIMWSCEALAVQLISCWKQSVWVFICMQMIQIFIHHSLSLMKVSRCLSWGL